MLPYVRTVKTALGAIAVQIVWSSWRGFRRIEHLGSAHDEAEVEALKAASSNWPGAKVHSTGAWMQRCRGSCWWSVLLAGRGARADSPGGAAVSVGVFHWSAVC